MGYWVVNVTCTIEPGWNGQQSFAVFSDGDIMYIDAGSNGRLVPVIEREPFTANRSTQVADASAIRKDFVVALSFLMGERQRLSRLRHASPGPSN